MKTKKSEKSEKLQRVLTFAGYKCVRVLTQKRNLKSRILKRIKSEYEEVLLLCGRMFKAADDHEFPVVLEPHDPRWCEAGIDEFCEDEFILIRRLCELDGYSAAFTSCGLMIAPKSESEDDEDDKVLSFAQAS